mgnify:CR=1 FL=1
MTLKASAVVIVLEPKRLLSSSEVALSFANGSSIFCNILSLRLTSDTTICVYVVLERVVEPGLTP